MNDLTTIQRLTNHLRRIESEIFAIRQELKALPEVQSSVSSLEATIPDLWVNKTVLKEQMRQLFLAFSIQGESVGAESLQQQMREAKLTSNELSQIIITAREE